MQKQLLFIGFLTISGIASALAQTGTPVVRERQENQQDRIHGGAANGELTKKEYRELERQQRRVNRHKKAVKSDGVVTKQERAGVQMHQNKASRDIRRKKHNARN